MATSVSIKLSHNGFTTEKLVVNLYIVINCLTRLFPQEAEWCTLPAACSLICSVQERKKIPLTYSLLLLSLWFHDRAHI